MNGYPYSEEGTPSKSHVQSLPSDYSDVQPASYDPEFISDISNKMQVPHNLGPKDEVRDPFGYQSTIPDVSAQHMMVPDRIFLADTVKSPDAKQGEGQHFGAKENLRMFDLSDLPPPESVPYVGMMTPPRTLTLEEQGFPGMDIKDEEPKFKQQSTRNEVQQSHNYNGSAVQLEPYTPGVSMNESLLLNEEDDTTLLKTQVAKLTRKVTLMEEDNIRRSNYEKVVYPIVFGWSIWKIVSVFWSLMRPRHY